MKHLNSLAQPFNRRHFLIATSATAAVTAIAGSIGAMVTGCGTAIAPGPSNTGLTVAQVPQDSSAVPAGADYILSRDAQGFYAYSNVCTHQGCALPKPDSAGESLCPCHGARFDANGNNLAGPRGGANVPDLTHYTVTFVGTGPTAQIVVDTSLHETDRTVRAPAP